MTYNFNEVFKFKIGDIVRHRASAVSGERMSLSAVIIARTLSEEGDDAIFKSYRVSSITDMDDVSECEIELVRDPDFK